MQGFPEDVIDCRSEGCVQVKKARERWVCCRGRRGSVLLGGELGKGRVVQALEGVVPFNLEGARSGLCFEKITQD